MLIKDLADHRLEIARYRRLRAAVVRHSVDHSTQAMLAQLRSAYQNQMSFLDEVTDRTRAEIEARGGANVAQDCAELDAYAASERDATDWLRDLVIAGTDNPTDDDVAANLPSWIGGYQQLDRCLQAAEQRFIATLRDIERHVAGFGENLAAPRCDRGRGARRGGDVTARSDGQPGECGAQHRAANAPRQGARQPQRAAPRSRRTAAGGCMATQCASPASCAMLRTLLAHDEAVIIAECCAADRAGSAAARAAALERMALRRVVRARALRAPGAVAQAAGDGRARDVRLAFRLFIA